MGRNDAADPWRDVELAACTRTFLRRRTWLNPDLRLIEWEGRLAVAKDWASAPLVLRLYGRWCLGREWRLLRRIEGLGGVPRPLARRRDAIVLSFCAGVPLSGRMAGDLPAGFFDDLDRLVAAIHARGVVHLDLRQRRNILLGEDGRPRLLDFGAGVDVGRWGRLGRIGLGWLERVDRLALLKLKGKYAPQRLSAEERRRARRAQRAGWLWPPNWLHFVKTRVRRLLRGRDGRTPQE
ncbi:MAG: hypothetical protein JXQ29_14710 [Planctomycetes bacterium]|nr:hypothetical protein [Planctomycetota bacterium]